MIRVLAPRDQPSYATPAFETVRTGTTVGAGRTTRAERPDEPTTLDSTHVLTDRKEISWRVDS